jgi:hypothetical protein
LYYNRTPSKAADLVASFGGQVISSLEESSENSDDNLGTILKRIRRHKMSLTRRKLSCTN